MEVNEMNRKIEKFCDNRNDCQGCPLENVAKVNCYGVCSPDESIKQHYKILFGNDSSNVDHPKHYQGKHECIDEMIAVFGVEAVKHFCMCNVWKYRYRASAKNGQEDLDKADWYMSKLMDLRKGGAYD